MHARGKEGSATESWTGRLRQTWIGEADAGFHTRAWWERTAQFCVLVVRGFLENRGPVRAAALSYATLLSLVPFLAVVLGVTSSLLKGRSEASIEAFVDRLVHAVIPPAPTTNLPPSAQYSLWFSQLHAGWWAPGLVGSVEPSDATSPAAGATAVGDPVAVGGSSVADAGAARTPAPVASTSEMRDLRRAVAQRIRAFIHQTRSAELGVTGSIALVLMAILLLARVENTMNDIWGVPQGRPWFLRVVLYWSFMTLGPLLVIGAIALGSGPYWEATSAWLARMPLVGGLVFQALPVLLLWLVFAGLYKLVPNTRVEWSAALLGGLLAAVCWHLNNLLNVLYVSRVVTNFKIYGSLGLVPVFMVGLYVAWVILLLGAQVAYTWQNRQAYLQQQLSRRIDQRGREFLAFRMMACLGQAFQNGEPPPSVSGLAASLGVPPRLCREILGQLQRAGLLWELAGPEPAYVPARPLETISLHDVLLAMRTENGSPMAPALEPAGGEIWGEYQRIQAAEKQTAAAITLRELVHRLGARPVLAQGIVPPLKLAQEAGSGAPTQAGGGEQPPLSGSGVPGGATGAETAQPADSPDPGPARVPPGSQGSAAAIPEDDRGFPL
ncbi:MAG: YihY family inner membrane protein [Limisphaera sp.]|nr:YihY family inner membrane protein [Limisphaera sp.]